MAMKYFNSLLKTSGINDGQTTLKNGVVSDAEQKKKDQKSGTESQKQGEGSVDTENKRQIIAVQKEGFEERTYIKNQEHAAEGQVEGVSNQITGTEDQRQVSEGQKGKAKERLDAKGQEKTVIGHKGGAGNQITGTEDQRRVSEEQKGRVKEGLDAKSQEKTTIGHKGGVGNQIMGTEDQREVGEEQKRGAKEGLDAKSREKTAIGHKGFIGNQTLGTEGQRRATGERQKKDVEGRSNSKDQEQNGEGQEEDINNQKSGTEKKEQGIEEQHKSTGENNRELETDSRTIDADYSQGSNPLVDDGHQSSPEVVPTLEEQKALVKETSYIAGGRNNIFSKFIPKRQEKGTRNTTAVDSLQKRVKRLTASAKAVSVKIEDLSDEQVIIAVMGPTGAGKSSFISKATGDNVGIGHDLQSCTTEIKIVKYECLDRSDLDVVFVDTPGFDDTERTDVEILEMIATWLNKTYERKITLAGILYFHRISDNRMAGTPLKNLRMFKELCGKNALQNIILTTTMWDEVDEKVGSEREKELRGKYWKAMIDQGSATARFRGTMESAWDIVDHFVQDANARHSVLLQEEMVDMKKQLRETNAGQELYTALEVIVFKQQETLQKIRAETKKHGDEVILNALRDEYENLRTQLAKTTNEMQTLKLPLGKRILRLVWSPLLGK